MVIYQQHSTKQPKIEIKEEKKNQKDNQKQGAYNHLKSLSSSVRSLISMPDSLMAAIVLGSSSRAVSASFERDVAALPIALRIQRKNRCIRTKCLKEKKKLCHQTSEDLDIYNQNLLKIRERRERKGERGGKQETISKL